MSNRHERRRQKKKLAKPRAQVTSQAILDLLQVGVDAIQQGQVDRAEAVFLEVLKQEPENADALHLLGQAYHAKGHLEDAAAITKLAITISDQPIFHLNLALTLKALNLIDDAIVELECYLKHKPDDIDVINTLGNYLRGAGKIDKAIEQYKKALKMKPGFVGIMSNLGLAYYYKGEIDKSLSQLNAAFDIDPTHVHMLTNLAMVESLHDNKDKALDLYKRALEIDPDFTAAEHNYAELLTGDDLEEAEERLTKLLSTTTEKKKTLLALISVLREQKKWPEALDYLHQAMVLDPSDPRIFTYFGSTLVALDQHSDAIQFLEGALELDPNSSDAYVQLSLIYYELLEFDKSIDACNKALKIRPAHPMALTNIAVVDMGRQRFKEANKALEKVVEQYPGFVDGRWNYSISLLALGKLKEGWREYRIRYKTKMKNLLRRKFPQPEWDGTSLKGKRIIVWAEQGIGDEFLFAHAIPDLIENEDAEIHIECDPRLVEFFQVSFPTTHVHPRPYEPAENGDDHFDFQIPFPNLCTFYRNSITDFPNEPGYLKADPKKIVEFENKLAVISNRPKIGISWRSALITDKRKFNYATMEDLAPIFAIDGVDFVSLQYGDCAEEIRSAKEKYGIEIHTWDDLNLKDDQDDLAALIMAVDAVIAPANAVIGLSGALGQRTFQFLPEPMVWTMLGTDHFPWFPAVRLFARQHRDALWDETFNDMAAAIRETLNLK